MPSSSIMTMIGVLGAMCAYLQSQLPPETPVYLKLLVGTLSAGISFYLGVTNRGSTPPPEQKVTVTVQDQPKPPPTIIKAP